MRNRTAVISLIVIAGISLISCQKKEAEPRTRETTVEQAEISNENVWEKGYGLPVDSEVKREAREDCKRIMELIWGRTSAESSQNEAYLGGAISESAAEHAMEALKILNAPVSADRFYLNMLHYEKMEEFLEKALRGERGEIIIYELRPEGGISRQEFTFNGTEMYLLSTMAAWNRTGGAIVTTTSYTRIKRWEYTEKGWFHYELCVPEPPEVTEIVNGNVMMRVKPFNESYRDIMAAYLLPLGYQGNNLFCSEWNEEKMEDLDYNGLFEAFYQIEYQKMMDASQYADGIPQEEFEFLMIKYLPITNERLRQYAEFHEETHTYGWSVLGCGNYAPKVFGTSIPEVTDIYENENGTLTITIDAVCEMMGTDAVFTHELTVRLGEQGEAEYLGNHILGDGANNIPAYQYRVQK